MLKKNLHTVKIKSKLAFYTLKNLTYQMVNIFCKKPPEPCSCRLGFSSMRRNDESTLFFNSSFSIFGPLRRPQGQNSGRSRSLTSLQIMFNLQSPQIINFNNQKITYFCHYVPSTKIPDYMNIEQVYNNKKAFLFTVQKGENAKMEMKSGLDIGHFNSTSVQRSDQIVDWSGIFLVCMHVVFFYFYSPFLCTSMFKLWYFKNA